MIPLFKVFMSPDAPAHVSRTLESGYIGEGPRVEEFENALSAYIGADVVTVNSGTSAIWLALDLLGVKKDTYVIASPMTCLASNVPALHLGAKVLWADVDRSGVIDPTSVKHLLEKLPYGSMRAILFTSYGGVPPAYDRLREVAGHIPLIEDAAHAFGTEFEGEMTGTFADITCFSFQAIKLLTTGDGGALVFLPGGRQDLLREAKLKRWFNLDRSKGGFRCDQDVRELGYKFHMNDIAASIGLVNLPHIPNLLQQTRDNALFYDEALTSPYIKGLSVPERPIMSNPSWWLYTLLVEKRDEFIEEMGKLGVQCARPHSRNDTHSIFSSSNTDLPGVKYFDEHQVAIPVGWWVNEEDREHIVRSIRNL